MPVHVKTHSWTAARGLAHRAERSGSAQGTRCGDVAVEALKGSSLTYFFFLFILRAVAAVTRTGQKEMTSIHQKKKNPLQTSCFLLSLLPVVLLLPIREY